MPRQWKPPSLLRQRTEEPPWGPQGSQEGQPGVPRGPRRGPAQPDRRPLLVLGLRDAHWGSWGAAKASTWEPRPLSLPGLWPRPLRLPGDGLQVPIGWALDFGLLISTAQESLTELLTRHTLPARPYFTFLLLLEAQLAPRSGPQFPRGPDVGRTQLSLASPGMASGFAQSARALALICKLGTDTGPVHAHLLGSLWGP